MESSPLINNNNNNSSSRKLFCISNFNNHDHYFPFKNFCDVEMVQIQTITYTSLKDILANSPPPVNFSSQAKCDRKDSWREIPIKDPLLQHAAWAYLQPMSSEPETGNGWNCFVKLKDCCCGLFGFFGTLLNDVVSWPAGE